VLPPDVRKRVTVEVGTALGWERYAGDEGAIVGLDRFGASAPAGTIFRELGFTVERVADVARRVVRGELRGRVPLPATAGPGDHPTVALGESGVDRRDDDDPGHS